jgi:hypothetical protein
VTHDSGDVSNHQHGFDRPGIGNAVSADRDRGTKFNKVRKGDINVA